MSGSLRDFPQRMGDWRVPGAVVSRILEPTSVAELAAILAAASREHAGLLIRGGGTRLGWANPARAIEFGLSTLGLKGVDVFEPDEGVLHARAGTSVAEVQTLARDAGWEVPLDPPGAASTVGGTIASAAMGPRSQVYGRVADALLGLDVVSAEGTVSKCGGRVVKNVTGYDLGKLYCGSFGVLGVVTGAWLRLRPLPKVRLARWAPLPRDPDGFEVCRSLARLTSVRALVWVEGEESDADADEGIYLELGGSEAEVAHDLDTFGAALSLSELKLDRMDALRDARAESRAATVLLRARVLGRDCEALVRSMRALRLAVTVDPGLGVAHARGDLEAPDALAALREEASLRGGFVTFERLPEQWHQDFDVFGSVPGSEGLMAMIKDKFDPVGILNPGRFQAGL